MTGAKTVELYYDPYDPDIDDNPYPVWKRMREEAPLYYNEKHNFYALSRYEDVARELPNWDTYRSGRGTTADISGPRSSSSRLNSGNGPFKLVTNWRESTKRTSTWAPAIASGVFEAAPAASLIESTTRLSSFGSTAASR